MTRTFHTIGWSVCLALSLPLVPTARADVTYTEAEDGLTIIRMSVTPATEPVPALKHRLVARDIDLQHGNAAPYYYRALLEFKDKFQRARKEFGDDFDTWYDTGDEATPIDKLPLDKVREADGNFRFAIETQVIPATSRRDCDWQLGVEDVRGVDLIEFVLDDFNTSRNLSRVLALRTRLAVAEQRYDDALDAMRMNYRLAVDTAGGPFLVCGLIGIAEAGITNGTLLELISAKNSPNLYWALTELPQPLVDLREAARFEMDFGPRMFPFIHHSETTDHSPAEWNRLYTQSLRDLTAMGGNNSAVLNDLGSGLAATAAALVNYSFAKDQLVAQGMDRERVEKMAVGQVMAIYTERNYQSFADDFQKLWYVPFWEMRERHGAVERRLEQARPMGGGPDREVLPVVSLLLPAMEACRAAQVRLERDIAALRVIEALRMYAASHAGGLPARLDEITAVSVPLNPATGQPFVYRLDRSTAVLELPASDGIPGYNRRVEIKIVQPEVSADDADERR